MARYAVGLDYGTNSVRALMVDIATGEEIAESVVPYMTGDAGIVTDRENAHLARQHPADYIGGLHLAMGELMARAGGVAGFSAADVVGIGVDTTASTPVPVDASAVPLAMEERFRDNPAAMAWLWKDHTAHAEAEELADLVSKRRLHYLDQYGGVYSSEWFWSKIRHCEREAPEVAAAAATWVELCDLIPAVLTGAADVSALKRGSCAAGYKGMFDAGRGGYPPEEFFGMISRNLAAVRRTLPARVFTPGESVGALSAELAVRWGLKGGIPVSAGIIDAHSGAIGSGIAPGFLVKILGTSSCDMALLPGESGVTAIPGISGVVRDGILPGYPGVEAGQAAVGDALNWYVRSLRDAGGAAGEEELHGMLTGGAALLRAGESGLLVLDWLNGNRNVLMDPRLTGLIAGCTLQTRPREIYRALIEATGFGARAIIERLREHGVAVEGIICCGGIAEKNDCFMQIYADILNSPVRIARTSQAPALGAAICGAVAAGGSRGGHDGFPGAIRAMTGLREKSYMPRGEESRVYDRLYRLYRLLHDAFGTRGPAEGLYPVMKELLRIKEEAAAAGAAEDRTAKKGRGEVRQ